MRGIGTISSIGVSSGLKDDHSAFLMILRSENHEGRLKVASVLVPALKPHDTVVETCDG